MLYEVTYYFSFAGFWESGYTKDKEKAETVCDEINCQARRGLRPFSSVYQVNSADVCHTELRLF